jgi:hypothetical protein
MGYVTNRTKFNLIEGVLDDMDIQDSKKVLLISAIMDGELDLYEEIYKGG